VDVRLTSFNYRFLASRFILEVPMNPFECMEQFKILNTAFVQATFEILNPLARLERLVSEEEEID
jgi:hypothetical protein